MTITAHADVLVRRVGPSSMTHTIENDMVCVFVDKATAIQYQELVQAWVDDHFAEDPHTKVTFLPHQSPYDPDLAGTCTHLHVLYHVIALPLNPIPS